MQVTCEERARRRRQASAQKEAWFQISTLSFPLLIYLFMKNLVPYLFFMQERVAGEILNKLEDSFV